MTAIYDVVVVGGGIHGVGVAQTAAADGYKVLLLEQSKLANGTSGRSSKLIHGGLRYLESRQFSLVRESLQERETLLGIAPDIIELKPFYIPIYRETTRKPWKIRAGLSLYALLGNLHTHNRFRIVPKNQWSSLDNLRVQGLRKVFQYHDAQADDEQLTRAIMRSACSLGAELKCPASFLNAKHDKQFYQVTWHESGKEIKCQCKALVNAAGPWVNEVLNKITPKTTALKIELIQGAHILLDQPAPKGIYYVEAPYDKRAIFIMPWHDKTLAGTTETPFEGDPAKVHALEQEIEYLLDTVSFYFPEYQRKIIESFAGIRVLPYSNEPAFHRPRGTILHTELVHPGLLTIYGGKLTGYRVTARKVMNSLSSHLPERKAVADTATLPLSPDQ
ncbi:MAG: FAD-dependent oxidoreductase [Gammaproteobacteria bacterium]|nr:MAG: FAD-dependent oxidoreductase [Gammaproteobacteria bacterium]